MTLSLSLSSSSSGLQMKMSRLFFLALTLTIVVLFSLTTPFESTFTTSASSFHAMTVESQGQVEAASWFPRLFVEAKAASSSSASSKASKSSQSASTKDGSAKAEQKKEQKEKEKEKEEKEKEKKAKAAREKKEKEEKEKKAKAEKEKKEKKEREEKEKKAKAEKEKKEKKEREEKEKKAKAEKEKKEREEKEKKEKKEREEKEKKQQQARDQSTPASPAAARRQRKRLAREKKEQARLARRSALSTSARRKNEALKRKRLERVERQRKQSLKQRSLADQQRKRRLESQRADVIARGEEKLKAMLNEQQKQQQQSSSRGGHPVLSFSYSQFKQYLHGAPRPFYTLVVLTALGSNYRCNMCTDTARELKQLAAIYDVQHNRRVLKERKQRKRSVNATAQFDALPLAEQRKQMPIFFVQLDIDANRELFRTLDIQTAPIIFLQPPTAAATPPPVSTLLTGLPAKYKFLITKADITLTDLHEFVSRSSGVEGVSLTSQRKAGVAGVVQLINNFWNIMDPVRRLVITVAVVMLTILAILSTLQYIYRKIKVYYWKKEKKEKKKLQKQQQKAKQQQQQQAAAASATAAVAASDVKDEDAKGPPGGATPDGSSASSASPTESADDVEDDWDEDDWDEEDEITRLTPVRIYSQYAAERAVAAQTMETFNRQSKLAERAQAKSSSSSKKKVDANKQISPPLNTIKYFVKTPSLSLFIYWSIVSSFLIYCFGISGGMFNVLRGSNESFYLPSSYLQWKQSISRGSSHDQSTMEGFGLGLLQLAMAALLVFMNKNAFTYKKVDPTQHKAKQVASYLLEFFFSTLASPLIWGTLLFLLWRQVVGIYSMKNGGYNYGYIWKHMHDAQSLIRLVQTYLPKQYWGYIPRTVPKFLVPYL